MEPSNTSTRKKFLNWGAVLLGSATVFKFFTRRNEEIKKPETVKMLAQDGTLVEVDKTLLAGSGKKISDVELQQWIKK